MQNLQELSVLLFKFKLTVVTWSDWWINMEEADGLQDSYLSTLKISTSENSRSTTSIFGIPENDRYNLTRSKWADFYQNLEYLFLFFDKLWCHGLTLWKSVGRKISSRSGAPFHSRLFSSSILHFQVVNHFLTEHQIQDDVPMNCKLTKHICKAQGEDFKDIFCFQWSIWWSHNVLSRF